MLFARHELDYIKREDYCVFFIKTNLEQGELYEEIYPKLKGSDFFVIVDYPEGIVSSPDEKISTYRSTRYCFTFE